MHSRSSIDLVRNITDTSTAVVERLLLSKVA
jgi:hypothetical protein